MSRRRKQIEEIEDRSQSHAGKKNIAVLLALIVILAGIGGASAYWMISQHSGSGGWSEENTGGGSGSSPILTHNSHKVIAELFVTTSCPYCALAENDLENMEGSRSDFYLVTMVADVNKDAYDRYMSISQRKGTPDTEFDGGIKSELGAVNSTNYASDIDYCKSLSVPEVSISGSAHASGSGISFSVSISSSGDFNGHVRGFVIEKVSSYINKANKPIPNAFMGYALNESISLSSSRVFSKSGTWAGNISDPSNMEIIVAVYDSNGHGVQAYRMPVHSTS